MQIDSKAAAELLRQQDRIVILTHHKPDGDTLGSGIALCRGLRSLGKCVQVLSPDGFPDRFAFLLEEYEDQSFKPSFVVCVDVGSPELLGCLREEYEQRIDLCIDHHRSNQMTAVQTLLDADAPATALIIWRILQHLKIPADRHIADAIFTGLSTDTGCFKYDNVTAETHHVAALMIELGAAHGQINKEMFDTISRGRLEVERRLLKTLEYHFDGRCAIVSIAAEWPVQYSVTEDELDGVSAIPRRIEGVLAGVTIRQRENGENRVSLRSGGGVDASRICSNLGGGGHRNAAGCTLTGTLDEVKERILTEIKWELDRLA